MRRGSEDKSPKSTLLLRTSVEPDCSEIKTLQRRAGEWPSGALAAFGAVSLSLVRDGAARLHSRESCQQPCHAPGACAANGAIQWRGRSCMGEIII